MTNAKAKQGSPAPRYDFEKIDLDSGNVHADVVQLAGDAERVLELGPATGYMSRAFAERGATVVGIEIDPEMASRAEEFCSRVIVADLDTLDLDAELGEERFDAIVAADVIEHLKDPLGALKRLRRFLTPEGAFVISVPNVAHGSVRLALLEGHFDYQDIGLLDSTHLRFFTRESLEELLDEAELGLAVRHRHELNLDVSEVPFDPEAVPPELREALEHDPEARTYQFVLKAIPMEREGLRELQRRLREIAELRLEADELRRKAERVTELEQALAEISGREGELRRALIESHDQLLARDAELEAMRIRLDSIFNSPPGRLYARLRDLPVLRWVERRRKAALEARLKSGS
ncbi:MAG: class I SAM-dependent methyltransferase [Solirubrobacterales bacterium]